MSPGKKVGVGVVVGLVLVWALPIPSLVTWILTLAVVGAPIALWFTLTPEQRRRVGRMRKRGQIDR